MEGQKGKEESIVYNVKIYFNRSGDKFAPQINVMK